MRPALRTLILDFGEVLVRAQSKEAADELARLAGASPGVFGRAYWTHRTDYDTHGDAERYWSAVLADCAAGARGAGAGWPSKASNDLIPALAAVDTASWTVYQEESWALAAEARAAGLETALLSNCAHAIMDRVRAERGLERHFDAVVISCEVGLVKPDPAIYRLCLD